MSVLACNICLRKDELEKQTQVDRLVKIVSSNYHDDEEQDILTVGMMIIRLNVDGEESNLRLASWFSLSTSSQAIGRLPSPSTCPLRLALRLIKIDEIVSFCILSSWGILVRLVMHLFGGEKYKDLWFYTLFIGPESDHWQCLSLTH